ncbi:MAG: hypothetical protein AABX73_03425 [Nanoarchaeota archaeon]
MVDKMGVARIAEAMISIMIIFGVIIFFYYQRSSGEEDLSDIIPPVLEEIAKDRVLRESVCNDNPTSVTTITPFLNNRINSAAFDYSFDICDLGAPCVLAITSSGQVYSSERVISACPNIANYAPKKVKISVWKK